MNLQKLKEFHGIIHDRIQIWKYLHLPLGKKIYFIGTPEYDNLGDSAIAIAEKLFLKKQGYNQKRIKSFTQSEFNNHYEKIKKHINNKHLICLIGGGNMGNQWYNEELFRYRVLDIFSDNPVIIFPQTVYFTDNSAGEVAFDKSVEEYNSKSKLTIVAREAKSFDFINKYYDIPQKILTPDIVLSTVMSNYNVFPTERQGALLVFRSDVEKSMTDEQRELIELEIKNEGFSFSYTDMYAGCSVNEENRFDLVSKKMQEFASAELVVTDRLHGMIFAAITGTPCIVFSNYNHKVKGTYEWIKYLPYIKYVEDVATAKSVIPNLLKMKDCKFDNKPLLPYFENLSKVVKKYAD